MKNNILFALSLLTFVLGCQKNPAPDSAKVSKTVEPATQDMGVIPSTAKINEYVLNSQDYTWKDIDTYYRNEVLVQRRQESYWNNLRVTTIGFLVNQFDFLKQADIKAVEFYANELQLVDLPDPEVVVKVLTRLQGHWTNAQITTLAQQVYDRNMQFIQEKLKNPEEYQNKFGSKWDELKKYSLTQN